MNTLSTDKTSAQLRSKTGKFVVSVLTNLRLNAKMKIRKLAVILGSALLTGSSVIAGTQPDVSSTLETWTNTYGGIAFRVIGNSAFSGYENAGNLVEVFGFESIGPGSDYPTYQNAISITGVSILPIGSSSDADDQMSVLPVYFSPQLPFSFLSGYGANSGGNVDAFFSIPFTPFDISGINDNDSGTTPFAITIVYNETFANVATSYDQTLTFIVNGTTLDVPEPSSLALLGIGAIGLLAYEWRRRTARA